MRPSMTLMGMFVITMAGVLPAAPAVAETRECEMVRPITPLLYQVTCDGETFTLRLSQVELVEEERASARNEARKWLDSRLVQARIDNDFGGFLSGDLVTPDGESLRDALLSTGLVRERDVGDAIIETPADGRDGEAGDSRSPTPPDPYRRRNLQLLREVLEFEGELAIWSSMTPEQRAIARERVEAIAQGRLARDAQSLAQQQAALETKSQLLDLSREEIARNQVGIARAYDEEAAAIDRKIERERYWNDWDPFDWRRGVLSFRSFYGFVNPHWNDDDHNDHNGHRDRHHSPHYVIPFYTFDPDWLVFENELAHTRARYEDQRDRYRSNIAALEHHAGTLQNEQARLAARMGTLGSHATETMRLYSKTAARLETLDRVLAEGYESPLVRRRRGTWTGVEGRRLSPFTCREGVCQITYSTRGEGRMNLRVLSPPDDRPVKFLRTEEAPAAGFLIIDEPGNYVIETETVGDVEYRIDAVQARWKD